MQDTPFSDSPYADWFAALDEECEERGYFQPLGANHSSVFTDEGTTLLVTFETLAQIDPSNDDAEPLGFTLVAENGWSHLGIIAHSDTWFRDPAVYGYFDRLVDDGFFEDFDNVVFYGEGMCGYAAAAFSVAAPGATIIAIQPQATLDPTITEWDKRFTDKRRSCFTDRYGFAPDMLEAADRAFVFYDPEVTMDAIHASFFARPHVDLIRMRFFGGKLATSLISLGIRDQIINLAGDGKLTGVEIHKLLRARRGNGGYLRGLANALSDRNSHRLLATLCATVTNRMTAPRFKRRLVALREDGILPLGETPEGQDDSPEMVL